jgi:hypothetical protein
LVTVRDIDRLALSGTVAFAVKSDKLSSNPELSAVIDESIREYHPALA